MKRIAVILRASLIVEHDGRGTLRLSLEEGPHVTCGDLSIDISGASRLTCTGSAAAVTLNVSGASHVDVLNCTGTRADVHLSGASEAWVDVGTRPIDLSASGASTLYYGGSPALTVRDLSGASRVVRVR